MDKFSEFNPKNLVIPTESFEDLLKFHSAKTVGKILKRMEITDNKEVMKSQIKELIYEQYRDLTDLILALNYGLEMSAFIFKSKEKENK